MDGAATVSRSLEAPTMLTVGDGPPVMAIVEELSMTHCRLRAIGLFSTGAGASFDVNVRGVPKFRLHGRISAVSEKPPRRVYTVLLERDQADHANIRAAVDAGRRLAVEHAHAVSDAPPGLVRSSVRVAVDIPLRYVTPNGATHTGRATNLSTGGMLLNSDDAIAVGTTIELQFALPGTARGYRVSARIVAHQQSSPNYNMAFFNIEPAARDAIARYVQTATTTAGAAQET